MHFDENADLAAKYTLINWHRSGEHGSVVFEEVGYYNVQAKRGAKLFIDKTKILWNGYSSEVTEFVLCMISSSLLPDVSRHLVFLYSAGMVSELLSGHSKEGTYKNYHSGAVKQAEKHSSEILSHFHSALMNVFTMRLPVCTSERHTHTIHVLANKSATVTLVSPLFCSRHFGVCIWLFWPIQFY